MWDQHCLVGKNRTVTSPQTTTLEPYQGLTSCRFELLFSIGLKSGMTQSYRHATQLFHPKTQVLSGQKLYSDLC